jgi:hypothetical protein
MTCLWQVERQANAKAKTFRIAACRSICACLTIRFRSAIHCAGVNETSLSGPSLKGPLDNLLSVACRLRPAAAVMYASV